jgi:two-component system repressor protein LuxO
MAYGWPGNVRQLENVIRNTVVLNDGAVVSLAACRT